MSDDNTPQSLDAKVKAAVKDGTQKLVALGMNPADADLAMQSAKDRIVAGGKGPLRVLLPYSLGGFYPGSFEDPIAPLVHEIFNRAPDEQKLVAVKRHEEAVEEIMEQKARSSEYLL